MLVKGRKETMKFQDKKVTVAGAGISGIAAAELLTGVGAIVNLYDGNAELTAEEVSARLSTDIGGLFVFGEFTIELQKETEVLVISPGVPLDLPFVEALKEKGVPVIGEIELAYQLAKGKMVAVTGTNGKTTTTALTGAILKTYFEHVLVVGNIGIPYTSLVHTTTETSVTVAEISSFQLETVDTFRPEVAMILNITPDHLNRHHTMENYVAAKKAIAAKQTADDVCILNYEDARLREFGEQVKSRVIYFSSARALEEGLYVEDGIIFYAHEGVAECICKTDELNIIGRHNYENAMAAIAAGIVMGVPYDLIHKALREFKAVEHRVEYVATKKGVRYYNDSKGTNPDAAIQAIRAMTGNTLLIAGGYDKGSEYDEWIEAFDGKVEYLVLLGQTREKIAEAARNHGIENIVLCDSFLEAMEFCTAHAKEGDTVLLSPACASWGMFKNYEERGRIFKEYVHALPKE